VEEELKKRKIFSPAVIIIGSVVIVVLAWFFVISPTLKDNEAKQKVIEVRRANLNILKDKLNKLKELSSQEDKIKEDTDKALAALPDNPDYARTLYQIERIGSQSGVFIKSISPSNLESGSTTAEGTTTTQVIPGVKELEYTLEIRGSYENFKSFLTSFYKGIRVSKIKKIDFKSSTGSSDSLDITITFSTFYKGGGDSSSGGTNATE